ncbi:MAG: DUF190 domain-containing protein [Rhodospirillaceae bacterium]
MQLPKDAIVFKAREMHLTGATVLRGPLGFGQPALGHPAIGMTFEGFSSDWLGSADGGP